NPGMGRLGCRPISTPALARCRQPAVARRAARQFFRLGLARNARLDERVIAGPVPLHLLPLALLADGPPAFGIMHRHHVNDPRRAVVHGPLPAGWRLLAAQGIVTASNLQGAHPAAARAGCQPTARLPAAGLPERAGPAA